MSHYLESQARIDEAEAALQRGDDARARGLYREAARLQRAFIDSIPAERVRTRSIYGLSAATLLVRAGDLDAAERLAHQLLSEPWLELQSADRLRVLLAQVWAERSSPAHSSGVEAGAAPPDAEARRGSPSPPRRARPLPTMGPGRRLSNPLGCPT